MHFFRTEYNIVFLKKNKEDLHCLLFQMEHIVHIEKWNKNGRNWWYGTIAVVPWNLTLKIGQNQPTKPLKWMLCHDGGLKQYCRWGGWVHWRREDVHLNADHHEFLPWDSKTNLLPITISRLLMTWNPTDFLQNLPNICTITRTPRLQTPVVSIAVWHLWPAFHFDWTKTRVQYVCDRPWGSAELWHSLPWCHL